MSTPGEAVPSSQASLSFEELNSQIGAYSYHACLYRKITHGVDVSRQIPSLFLKKFMKNNQKYHKYIEEFLYTNFYRKQNFRA